MLRRLHLLNNQLGPASQCGPAVAATADVTPPTAANGAPRLVNADRTTMGVSARLQHLGCAPKLPGTSTLRPRAPATPTPPPSCVQSAGGAHGGPDDPELIFTSIFQGTTESAPFAKGSPMAFVHACVIPPGGGIGLHTCVRPISDF